MLALAHPDLMGLVRPGVQAVAGHEPTVGPEPRIFGRAWVNHEGLEGGVDPIGGHDKIRLEALAIGEAHDCLVSCLRETRRTMPGAHSLSR